MKVNPPWLCLITSDSRSKHHDVVQLVREAVSGGVNMVQLRTETTDPIQLTKVSKQIRDITLGRSLFLVNSNVKLAICSGADGVHFKEKDVIPTNLKNEIGRDFMIGKSVHSVTGAISAYSSGADYLTAGTIFASKSHPGGETKGPKFISEIISNVNIPVIGVGGIGHGNVVEVMEQKASGVAVIGAITESVDPKIAASGIWSLLEGIGISGEKNGNYC